MKGKILLIDDEELVIRTLVRYLKIYGYEVEPAANGEEAIKKAEIFPFDLVIVDMRMPGIDGIETIKRLRDIFQKKHKIKVPEIIITGYAADDSKKEAKDLGVRVYIDKPFDNSSFLEAVKNSLLLEETTTPEVRLSPSADNRELIDSFINGWNERIIRNMENKASRFIGWTNTCVPEEIIIAAGFLPYRVMGAPVPLSLSKTYLSGNFCPSIQSILECGLKGDYDFLSGIIIGSATDATIRLYDAWINYVNTPFCYSFDPPKIIDSGSLRHYMESTLSLIEEIEKKFKVKITRLRIRDAISICNKTRTLLNELNDTRRSANPPVSAQQFLKICKLAMTADKHIFNPSLEKLNGMIRPGGGDKKIVRIILTGSFHDSSWLLDIIEERGGMVVCEDMCTRLRYFSGLVNEKEEDLVKAISRRYLNAKLPSASLGDPELRSGLILKLINDFKADGVIYYVLKFDDPYLFEYPDVKDILSARNIPVLRVESEHSTSAVGQINTRIQAFMETLKLRRLKK